MTIKNTTPRVQYAANSGQVNFAYPFKIFEDSDLVVFKTPEGSESDDVSDLMTLGTDYTVTGAGAVDGGLITLTTAASTNDIVTITRDVPESRSTDLVDGGDLLANTLNTSLDRFTAMVQEVGEAITRTFRIKTSSSDEIDTTMPDPLPDGYWKWDSQGAGLVFVIPESDMGDASGMTYIPGGSGAQATDVQTKLRESISPMDFGATADGSNERAAVQAAIDHAGSITSMFGAPVVVDLGGLTYSIEAKLSFTDINRVALMNGRLLATGTWTDPYMVEFDGVDAKNRCHNNQLVNVVLDCNNKTSGVFSDFTQRLILRDVTAMKFTATGFKTMPVGNSTELHMDHCIAHEGILSSWGEPSVLPTITTRGFDIQSADFIMTGCVAHSCGIQARFGGDTGFSNGQIIGCHFYGSNLDNAAVAGTANNGGEVQIATTAAHGYETDTYVLIEGVNGTDEANGYWKITVDSATQFTLNGSAYASAWTSGGTVYASRPTMIVEDDVVHLMFSNMYLDASVSAFYSFEHNLTNCNFLSGALGLRAALVMVAGQANETGKGFMLTGGFVMDEPRFESGPGGEWNADYKATRMHQLYNAQTDQFIGARGPWLIDAGQLYAPGLMFSRDGVQDFNTGLYSPAADEVGVVCNQKEQLHVSESETTIGDGVNTENVNLNGGAAYGVFFRVQKAGTLHWAAGGAGSSNNYVLNRHHEGTGAYVDTPVSVDIDTGVMAVSTPFGPMNKTVAEMASYAASDYTGRIAYVSNGAVGLPVLAFSDGTSWLRCDTRAAIASS